MEIHQFTDSFVPGDAVSHHVLQLQDFFQSEGKDASHIYVNYAHKKLEDRTLHFSEFDYYNNDSILIFHYSIYSEVYDYFRKLRAKKKILIFHNVTSPEFFEKDDKFRINHIEPSFPQIRTFQSEFDYAIADSTFNKNVLKEHGFNKKVYVIPPFLDVETKFRPVVERIQNTIKKPTKTTLLFVSQILHHKRQDDVIKAFRVYRKFFNKNAQLVLVGASYAGRSYYKKVLQYAESTPGVILAGKVPLEELIRWYMTADVFVCMSEHEGFGVPLVESLYFNLPIVAYNAGAVAETVGQGGIIVNEKDYFVFASLIDTIVTNEKVRKAIKQEQKSQWQQFDYSFIKQKLSRWILKKGN